MNAKQEYALYLPYYKKAVKRDDDGAAASMEIRIVAISGEHSDVIKNPDGGSEFDDFAFSARIHPSYGISFGGSWETGYLNVYSVDANRAKAMVQTFKKLYRIKEKLLVNPVTFGQYVTMIARGFGIKRVAQCREAGTALFYNDAQHSFLDLKHAATVIDSIAQQELDELKAANPEKVSA